MTTLYTEINVTLCSTILNKEKEESQWCPPRSGTKRCTTVTIFLLKNCSFLVSVQWYKLKFLAWYEMIPRGDSGVMTILLAINLDIPSSALSWNKGGTYEVISSMSRQVRALCVRSWFTLTALLCGPLMSHLKTHVWHHQWFLWPRVWWENYPILVHS